MDIGISSDTAERCNRNIVLLADPLPTLQPEGMALVDRTPRPGGIDMTIVEILLHFFGDPRDVRVEALDVIGVNGIGDLPPNGGLVSDALNVFSAEGRPHIARNDLHRARLIALAQIRQAIL